MKFRILLKDPDGFCDGFGNAAIESFPALNADLSDDEFGAVISAREEKFKSFAKRWVEYGEYITIEFDTEANTATVVELGK